MIVSHKPNLILPLANSYSWVYRFTMESKVILLMLTALGGVIASPNRIAESGHKGGRYLITQDKKVGMYSATHENVIVARGRR